jgi:flagellar hook-basal body complex protein FliE
MPHTVDQVVQHTLSHISSDTMDRLGADFILQFSQALTDVWNEQEAAREEKKQQLRREPDCEWF